MEILAIIPAREGSKSLPGKNIKILNGHPLIAYSILACQKIPLINRVIVSTDSDKIASVAKEYGAEIPFMRPKEIAQDMSTDFEVFYYTLNQLKEKENYIPDFVIQLRPTSPIRFVDEIETCINLMKTSSEADSLRIVTPAPTNPFKMWEINDKSVFMKPLLNLIGVKEPFNEPRQKLPAVYWQVGTLDIIRTSVILTQKSISGNNILPYVIENKFAIDIDNIKDFEKAEDIIRNYSCIKFE